MYAQLIDDEAGETLAAASSLGLKEDGSLKQKAKVVGEAIAEAGNEADITDVVFDRGGYKYTGRVEALAESARDNGLEF